MHRLRLLLPFLIFAEEVLLGMRLSVVMKLVLRRDLWRGFRCGLRTSMKFGLLESLFRNHLDLKTIIPSLLGELHPNFM